MGGEGVMAWAGAEWGVGGVMRGAVAWVGRGAGASSTRCGGPVADR
jgi:hypothetical protein